MATKFQNNLQKYAELAVRVGLNLRPGQCLLVRNQSLIHVDFMIGSDKMAIDGLTADGRVEPVLRKGEWAFSV